MIHFASLEGDEISPENAIIHETTLEKFLSNRTLKIDNNTEVHFSETEIVRRARSRLSEKGYNLFKNNCEHFARWCATGENISYQIINLPQKIENAFSVLDENVNIVLNFIDLFK